MRKPNEQVVATLPNLFRILLDHEDWKGIIGYDEFSGVVVKRRKPPFGAGAEIGEWSDLDDGRLALWLAQQFNLDPKDTMLSRAVMNVADVNRFHPVRDYLVALAWDGVPRLNFWLCAYLGAEPRYYALADEPRLGGTQPAAKFLGNKYLEVKKLQAAGKLAEYTAAVGAKFMIGAVARVLRAGCKMDNVLILEGVQYLGKSSALSVLAEPWFTDQQIKIGDKDTYEVMRGQWVVELPELDALSRAETASAKAFFSRPVDRFRTFYGRRAAKVSRQCVFAGTVNHYQYFQDSSGNRRYWPVRCTRVDLEELARERDQLWAEALVRFKADEKWWVLPDEKPMFDAEAEARYVGDAWENRIRRWLEDVDQDGARNEVTMDQLLAGALALDAAKWTRSEQTRVGQLMERIGWGSRGRPQGDGGARLRVYRRPGWEPASNLSNLVQPRPTYGTGENA